MSKQEIQTLLSEFSADDRLELAGWLLESVAEPPTDEVLAESMQIAEERHAQLESGQAISHQVNWRNCP